MPRKSSSLSYVNAMCCTRECLRPVIVDRRGGCLKKREAMIDLIVGGKRHGDKW